MNTLPETFPAFWVERRPDGSMRWSVVERRIEDLPPGDVLVEVEYSSLNYKDALSAAGRPGITRAYPHTPGIDAAGIVRRSAVDAFRPGDRVIVTGHDLGVQTPGGWAGFIRVPAEWVVPLPSGLTTREAMILGTAGFTAAQCLWALLDRHGLDPRTSPAAVTGATGGVGCLAVALLARAGFAVTAITGKLNEAGWLGALGARETLDREAWLAGADRPLLKGRWDAGVDTVGGAPLSALLRSIRYRGAVAACGNAAGAELTVSVYPFILRGVALYGIDSAACPMDRRLEMWRRLAGPWRLPTDVLDAVADEIALGDLPARIDAMLAGRARGRTLVRPS